MKYLTLTITLLFASMAFSEQVIEYTTKSDVYNNKWVVEHNTITKLKCIRAANNFAPEIFIYKGCKSLDNPNALLMEHERYASSALLINPNVKRALVIGLGAGSIVQMLTSFNAETRVDMVEPDKLLIGINQKYLGYTNQDGRVENIIADPREFIKDAKTGTYDLIISSQFTAAYIPSSIITQEAYKQFKRIMTDDGLFVHIRQGQPTIADTEAKTIHSVFGDYYYSNVGEASDSRVIFARPAGLVDSEVIRDNALNYASAFSLNYGIGVNELLPKIDNDPVWDNGSDTLHDAKIHSIQPETNKTESNLYKNNKKLATSLFIVLLCALVLIAFFSIRAYDRKQG